MSKMKPRYYWDIVEITNGYQMGPQKHREYLLDLLKKHQVSSILDVGCGTGPIYHLIQTTAEPTADAITMVKRWDFKYKGVDYSHHFINWAKKKFGKMFEVQDARHLKEKDNSWDCVLLLHSLDHVKQYDEVIKEAVRVSKKYVCIVLWRDFRLDDLVVVNDRNMLSKKEGEEPWEDTYLTQYSKKTLEKEFTKNKLKIVAEVGTEELASEQCKYSYLYLLEK